MIYQYTRLAFDEVTSQQFTVALVQSSSLPQKATQTWYMKCLSCYPKMIDDRP